MQKKSVANQELVGQKNAVRALTALLLVLNFLSVNTFPQLEKASVWSFRFCQEAMHIQACQNYDTLHTRECNLNYYVQSQLTSMLDKDKKTLSQPLQSVANGLVINTKALFQLNSKDTNVQKEACNKSSVFFCIYLSN